MPPRDSHATMAMLQRRQNHESTQVPTLGSPASGSLPSPSAECRQCKPLIAGHMHVLAQETHPWARAPRRLGHCPAPRRASRLYGPPACPPRRCRPHAPARPAHTPPEVHHISCNSEARVFGKLLLDAATVRRRRLVHELKSVARRNILPDHCASLASTSPDREVSQHLEKQHHTWYLYAGWSALASCLNSRPAPGRQPLITGRPIAGTGPHSQCPTAPGTCRLGDLPPASCLEWRPARRAPHPLCPPERSSSAAPAHCSAFNVQGLRQSHQHVLRTCFGILPCRPSVLIDMQPR